MVSRLRLDLNKQQHLPLNVIPGRTPEHSIYHAHKPLNHFRNSSPLSYQIIIHRSKMRTLLSAFSLFSLLTISLSSPVVPRATTSSVIATITPGSTGPSTAAVQSAISGCSNTNLAGVTDNDIVNGVCKEFTLIFARGVSCCASHKHLQRGHHA
jgi:hypothetical protein